MSLGAIIQIFYEFAPLVTFFIAGQFLPFTEAVLALIVATCISLAVAWTYHRQIPVMPLLSGGLTLITGTITVYFNEPNAIIIADTIYFWGLALAILVGFTMKRHMLERMFDKTFAMTKAGWTKLSWRWFVVLVIAGMANEYVRITTSPEFWIDYRFTKIMIITAFSFYQFTLARRYRIEGESNSWGLRI